MRFAALILIVLGAAAFDQVGSAEAMPVISGEPDGKDDAAGSVIVLTRCPVEYDRMTTLGAHLPLNSSGKLKTLSVRLGDRVKANQVIGLLFDDDVQLDLKRLDAEISNELPIQRAESKLAMATSRLNHSKALGRRNLISEEDMVLHEFDVKEAQLALEDAKHVRLVTGLARDRLRVDLKSRELVAPHNGVVVEILKNPGESLSPNEPMVQIVDVDILEITGFVDAADSWRVRVGQSVKIYPDLNGSSPEIERQEFQGKVVFVDSRIDKISQTCRVMAEAENRESLLRSGLDCRMIISLNPTKVSPILKSSINDPLKGGELDQVESLKTFSLNPKPRLAIKPLN